MSSEPPSAFLLLCTDDNVGATFSVCLVETFLCRGSRATKIILYVGLDLDTLGRHTSTHTQDSQRQREESLRYSKIEEGAVLD